MELKKGRTYYMITYADRDFTMPGIEPMVYIGKNAYLRSLEDSSDSYQFQDTVSFVRYGYVMDTAHKEECIVEVFREENFGIDITTLEGAAEVLARSLERKVELNEPTLRVAKGKWHSVKTETWVEIEPGDTDAHKQLQDDGSPATPASEP